MASMILLSEPFAFGKYSKKRAIALLTFLITAFSLCVFDNFIADSSLKCRHYIYPETKCLYFRVILVLCTENRYLQHYPFHRNISNFLLNSENFKQFRSLSISPKGLGSRPFQPSASISLLSEASHFCNTSLRLTFFQKRVYWNLRLEDQSC